MKPCLACEGAKNGQCLPILEKQPSIREFVADGLFIAEITVVGVNTFVPQHSHCYDHLTFVAAGAVRVYREGTAPREIHAPNAIEIPAGTKHTFETLSERTILLCIHNTMRTGAIEIAEEHQIGCR